MNYLSPIKKFRTKNKVEKFKMNRKFKLFVQINVLLRISHMNKHTFLSSANLSYRFFWAHTLVSINFRLLNKSVFHVSLHHFANTNTCFFIFSKKFNVEYTHLSSAFCFNSAKRKKIPIISHAF